VGQISSAQDDATQESSRAPLIPLQPSRQLGVLLCWAIVFADIGTSVYYVPGILYGTVGPLTGLFVFATMLVFLLLAVKYAEVTYRFPQGGGVVTVASHALNPWFGALGGMFILVDYFLTAAISCLSGMLYLSVVLPALGPENELLGLGVTVWVTLAVLGTLGVLNWFGIGASARVSLMAAIIAFLSDIAILVTVFTHLSLNAFWALLSDQFTGVSLTPTIALIGFAGSFLAFSGLESVSQLAPDMKLPRRRVGIGAMFLVVVTIGVTTPLLALLSTVLLPDAAADPVRSSQLISLLGGHWGGTALQTEVAISAGALLVFAANTAIIGAYHVFLALARLEFFPALLLRRNRLRGTPHYAIGLATLIPVAVLVLVRGNIATLGDMYAFGLLGAFTLTCLGMDIVRVRERADRRRGRDPDREVADPSTTSAEPPEREGVWARSWINLQLGFLTTILVLAAWSINLVAKPLATTFGGVALVLGMGVATIQYVRRRRRGRLPVASTGVEPGFAVRVLAVLAGADDEQNEAVMRVALAHAGQGGVVFLYLGDSGAMEPAGVYRLAEAHVHDPHARAVLGRAYYLARAARAPVRFVYRHLDPDAATRLWRFVQPHEVIVARYWQALVQAISTEPVVVESPSPPHGSVDA
jgi:amino acid transporter